MTDDTPHSNTYTFYDLESYAKPSQTSPITNRPEPSAEVITGALMAAGALLAPQYANLEQPSFTEMAADTAELAQQILERWLRLT